MSPEQHYAVRQMVLQWAVSTAKNGEAGHIVVERAERYLDFLMYPLRADVAAATRELIAANANANAGPVLVA